MYLFIVLLTVLTLYKYVSGVFEYHNTPLAWPEAVQTCAENGGLLAERSSFTDIQIQKVMESNNVSDIWTGKYLTPWTWLAGCIRMTAKTLNSMMHTSFKANQQKRCQNHCPESNFYGLKGIQCYCLDTYTGTMAIPADHCTDGCPGNHDERCGGKGALTLYRNDQCWDKPNPYIGTISNSYSGKTCQNWTSDTPHVSKYNKDSQFPSGPVNNASNYCRNPDNDYNYQWCYTTDPAQRWEKCTIPRCVSPKASGTKYMCMAFRYIQKQFEAIQSGCDSKNNYVCRDEINQFRLIKLEETWHTSRDKCRHKYLGLTDEHAFKESYHWAGYFRNYTVLSEMTPNKSPDYCYNMQMNNDQAEETISLCTDEKAFICQKGSNGDGRTKESNNNKDQSSNDDKNATQGGLIAGICGGLIAIVASVVVAFIFLCRRNKKHQEARKETVSTIATSNHNNVHTHTEYVNTSIDTPQLYGNLDAGNHPPHANAKTLDKSDEDIHEYETVGDNSTRETSLSLDPDTYTVLNQDHNTNNEHEYGSISNPDTNNRK